MNRSHNIRNNNGVTQHLLMFLVTFLFMAIVGVLCRVPLPLNIFISAIVAVVFMIYEGRKQSPKVSKDDMTWMQRIAEQWGGKLTTEIDCQIYIAVDDIDAFFSYDVRRPDLTVTFYTYTNSYTQNVKYVINRRLNDIQKLEGVTCDVDIERTLFGALFFLNISRADANDLLLGRIKTLFERIKEDERSHQTDIYFKVIGVEYDDDVCYFECSFQSEIKRAMIVWPDKMISRYDVSKGDSLPEELDWMQQGDIDCIEDDESFELLSPQEFQQLWESVA